MKGFQSANNLDLSWKNVYPGVWTFQTGNPVLTLTGVSGRTPSDRLNQLPETACPEHKIQLDTRGKYTVLRMELDEDERVFGGGLLFKQVITENQVYHLRVDHYAGS